MYLGLDVWAISFVILTVLEKKLVFLLRAESSEGFFVQLRFAWEEIDLHLIFKLFNALDEFCDSDVSILSLTLQSSQVIADKVGVLFQEDPGPQELDDGLWEEVLPIFHTVFPENWDEF